MSYYTHAMFVLEHMYRNSYPNIYRTKNVTTANFFYDLLYLGEPALLLSFLQDISDQVTCFQFKLTWYILHKQ